MVFFKRFPVVGARILNSLDDKSLARSKEASKKMVEFLENERFYWIRMIRKNKGKFQEHEEAWKLAIIIAPVITLKELAFSMQKLFRQSAYLEMVSPLQIAVETGSLEICKYIFSKTGNKNPVGDFGETPLHIAASYGYLDICRLIIENGPDKNPADNTGRTPLHLAARNGHLHICRLIINITKEKISPNNWGETPLHEAAENGHMDVCRFFFEQVEEKNPADGLGNTPLHYLALHGNFDVFKLIFEKIEVHVDIHLERKGF